MKFFGLYFLLKVALHHTQGVGFHWPLNVLLALCVFWPLAHGPARRWRDWLAWHAALALVYHESVWPSPERIWATRHAWMGFSPGYVWELLQRVVNPWALLGLVALAAVYAALARRLRFALWAWMGIASVPVWGPAGWSVAMGPAEPVVQQALEAGAAATGPDAQLQTFYQEEAQRKLRFAAPAGAALAGGAGAAPAFDVVVLHVCSLSWDDLDVTNARKSPLFSRFDAVFTHFNSAASYSGPATVRLFRGNCGQTPHAQLYKPSPDGCQVFPALARLGYNTRGLLNHDGRYEQFAQLVQSEGQFAQPPLTPRAAPVHMQSFDGSAIHDDLAVLSHWWAQRQAQGGAPQALYYNTISLHDGNRLPGVASRSSLDTYRPRLYKLLNDFERFIAQLEASGKPVVLLLVPEHGASLRGDHVQMAGMREIPDPKVTLGPAAIKLIGLPAAQARALNSVAHGPVVVTRPVSYFGLNSVLADLLLHNPFAPGARPLAERLGPLGPLVATPFVAENDDLVMLATEQGLRLKSGDGTWLPYHSR